MSKNKLLIICGPSGSGKSVLETNLLEDYPDIFHKWQQVSTRKKRKNESNGNPYVFIEKETFGRIKDVLVGRIGAGGDSTYNGDCYGSIPDFVENKISTVILAEEGLLDILKSIENNELELESYLILGLDVEFDKLEKDAIRENRDMNFFEQERNVLKYATILHKTSNGKYLESNIVVDHLLNKKMIKI